MNISRCSRLCRLSTLAHSNILECSEILGVMAKTSCRDNRPTRKSALSRELMLLKATLASVSPLVLSFLGLFPGLSDGSSFHFSFRVLPVGRRLFVL
jgi:hypothetical protein